MDFLDLLKKRKSIRKFKKTPISDKVLKYILECGINSPSACNTQPYRFVVMSGKFKDKFCEEVFNGVYSFCKFVKDAPVIIAIVRVKNSIKMKIGEFVCDCDFSLLDIGIAGEHIVLASTYKNLGSLWVGWFDRKKANKILGVSKNERVEILIAIGEKDEEPTMRKKKEFSKMVSFFS